MTKRSLEQQINAANDRLARLKARQKKIEVRQQIVLGAAIMAAARMNADNAKTVLSLIEQAKLKDAEARDLAPLLGELQQLKDNAGTDNE